MSVRTRRRAALSPDHALVAAWCALSASILLLAPLRALRDADKTDFVAFLTGARILSSGSSCLYCFGTEASVQTGVVGHQLQIGLNQYANPPAAALLLRPIAGLDLEAALAIFLAASVVALAGTALLAWRLLDTLPARPRAAVTIASIALLPGAEALAFGQWDPFLLLAAVVAVGRLRRGDDAVAGVVLAALCVKPQVLWLVPVLLVAGRHRRAIAGLSAGVGAWIVSGLLIVGPSGARQWLDDILPGRVSETSKSIGLPSLVSDATGVSSAAFAASALLAIAVLVVAWRDRQRLTDPACTVAAGLALSLPLAPHVFDTDLLLLTPALLLIGRRAPAEALGLTGALGLAYLVDLALPGRLAHVTAFAVALVAWRSVAVERALAPEPQAAAAPASPARSRKNRWSRRSPVISG